MLLFLCGLSLKIDCSLLFPEVLPGFGNGCIASLYRTGLTRRGFCPPFRIVKVTLLILT